MKNLLFAVLVLLSITVTSQSKQETQDWIISKLTQYGNVDSNRYELKFVENKKGEVSFVIEDSFMIPNITRVPINAVINMHIYSGKEEVVLVLVGKENSISRVLINKTGSEVGMPKYRDDTDIFLHKNFVGEDLTYRIRKAFRHLVKLYGGKMKETF
ncbi:hypothetical protein [Seonamhaeicola marinus]|uniref:DUF4468 domain-containing protein n=1 Tax=Seonamhaeicola marinus TaxID=1912246 RepID=A0A5D0HXQ7_9FLAO|nr:hypothetical protein [Seonamhaeicola marinus]TYA74232.1 hypothetical protein FUA24_12940 [Seonamhaeicola marinus]